MKEVTLSIPAVEVLRAHIDKHYGGSVNKFARENKLDGPEIGKILRQSEGRGTRTTVAFAARIREATKGEIGLELWIPVEET